MAINDRITRPRTPARFLRERDSSENQPVIVCAGDSITHGVVSANYVEMVESNLGALWYTVVNAGISGDLAWNLRERLDEIVACAPEIVTILIGTNDSAARIDESWLQGYMKQKKLPRRPDLDWYREQLLAIVTRLQQDTKARIAILTIPPIGEDLESSFNDLVRETNSVIEAVAAQTSVTVLPLYERLVLALGNSQRPKFDGTKKLMGRAAVRRLLLRRPYDKISERVGRHLLTDDIHLNARAARIVADEVLTFVAGA